MQYSTLLCTVLYLSEVRECSGQPWHTRHPETPGRPRSKFYRSAGTQSRKTTLCSVQYGTSQKIERSCQGTTRLMKCTRYLCWWEGQILAGLRAAKHRLTLMLTTWAGGLFVPISADGRLAWRCLRQNGEASRSRGLGLSRLLR